MGNIQTQLKEPNAIFSPFYKLQVVMLVSTIVTVTVLKQSCLWAKQTPQIRTYIKCPIIYIPYLRQSELAFQVSLPFTKV